MYFILTGTLWSKYYLYLYLLHKTIQTKYYSFSIAMQLQWQGQDLNPRSLFHEVIQYFSEYVDGNRDGGTDGGSGVLLLVAVMLLLMVIVLLMVMMMWWWW